MYKNKIKGERLRQPLTKKEKKEILGLVSSGMKQVAIARAYRVHPMTIARLCQANGVGRWAELTPEIEGEVVRQLLDGRGLDRVAKAMRVPDRVVSEIMEKHKIPRHPVGAPPLEVGKRARIVAAIHSREDHIYRLAKKIGVHRGTLSRIAHAIAGVDRFIGYPNIPPLTAEEPVHMETGYAEFLDAAFRKNFSKEAQVREMRSIFSTLVKSYLDIWCAGVVPGDRASFASEVLNAYLPETLRERSPFTPEEWDRERENIGQFIRAAVDAAAGTQTGLVH
jgi:hypothetical protein